MLVNSETVKNETGIFWNDSQTEKRINRYIEQGKAFLREHAGNENLEFDENTTEGALLIHYVEYAYYKKSEYFEQNYKSDLIWLRFKHKENADEQ